MHCFVSLKTVIIFRQDHFNHLKVKLNEISLKDGLLYFEESKMYVSYKIFRLKPLRVYFAVHSRSQAKKKGIMASY